MSPLILGLPRSRTAWLSAFMSQSSTHFYHEAINGCFSLDEYENKIKGFGDSTTGIIPIINNIKEKKILVIKKTDEEIERCIQWCNSTYQVDSSRYINDCNNVLNGIDAMVINQNDIDQSLKKIWTYLVDDPWLDVYGNIKKMNIQVSDTSINKEAAKAIYETIQ